MQKWLWRQIAKRMKKHFPITIARAFVLLLLQVIAATSLSAQTCEPQTKLASGQQIRQGSFAIRNNKWAWPATEGSIFLSADGSFGWTWNRGDSNPDSKIPSNFAPNYPDVLWGQILDSTTSSTTDLLPKKIRDINQLRGQFDVTTSIASNGFRWNSNVEIWASKTDSLTKDQHTHEIMIMFDWHNDNKPSIKRNAITSGTKNYHYHLRFENVTPKVSGHVFHIFHIEDKHRGHWPSAVEIKPFFDFLRTETVKHQRPFTGDYWLAGIMIGNENWDLARGNTLVKSLSWTLNGSTESVGKQPKGRSN